MKTHRFSDIKRSREPARAERVRQRVDVELVEMTLAELRREAGITQTLMAEAAKMDQGELSRVERRDDHLVSTLRRYMRALGGDIEITAVLGNKRVRLPLP